MEAGLFGRVYLGTDVAARNGIRAVPVDRPFRERPDVGFVEALEPGLAERRGRAQLAGAKGGQRPARRLNGFGDPIESVGQRYGLGERSEERRVGKGWGRTVRTRMAE